jgi:hypothetical protein
MREYHVVFMYYAYPLLSKFSSHLKDERIDAPGSSSGKTLIKTMKHLLRGLHLTKGFSSTVITIL